AYVDADIGRSTVGPPACVGLKFCSHLDKVDAATVATADELAFVGATSIEGHLLPLVASTARLVQRARDEGCELIIVDTSASVSGIPAQILKYYKLELIGAAWVVGFQRGEELDPILGVISRFFPCEVTALKVDPTVLERSAEQRLSEREAAFASYFGSPLSKWRVKPTVFMPAIPPEAELARLDGLLVGLEDGAGHCPGIGLLEFLAEDDALRMVSPVAEGTRGLKLGSIRISTEGKTLGRISLAEIFGG
ncbi:MAG: Clp1/GlmU family protein, partial [Actinomycetota bacterium]